MVSERLRVVSPLLLAAVACSSNEPAPRERATTTSPAPGGTDFQKLVGRWLRNDMSYMIEIASVSPNGTLEARYLNPQPIHVSKAEARRENGATRCWWSSPTRAIPVATTG